jgi:hypothetical protein
MVSGGEFTYPLDGWASWSSCCAASRASWIMAGCIFGSRAGGDPGVLHNPQLQWTRAGAGRLNVELV